MAAKTMAGDGEQEAIFSPCIAGSLAPHFGFLLRQLLMLSFNRPG